MIALRDGAARSLHREVLVPAEEVQRADRVVPLRCAEQRRLYRLPDGLAGDPLGVLPAAACECAHQVVEFADENDIQRVAVAAAVLIGSATG